MSKLIVLVFFVVTTFPAYKALRHPYMISGHDADAALFKTMEMDQALRDGHFPVRWAKRLNFGLGQPTFTFLYNLPYYMAVGFHRVGLSYDGAVKMVLGLGFPLGAWFTYLWLRNHFPAAVAITGGFIYTLIPYQFANVYVRFALGEAVAGMFVPLTFWAIDNLTQGKSARKLLWCTLVCSLVILSNNFYALIFTLVWLAYALIMGRKSAWLTAGAIFWAFGLAAYFVIPAYIYKDITHLVDSTKWFLTNDNFANLVDLIRPSWGFGGYTRPGELPGLMSIQIGLVQLVLLVASGILLAARRGKRIEIGDKLAGFFLILFAVSVFLMLRSSLFLWQAVPVIQNLQFPWRLLFVVRVCGTFCGAYALNRFYKSRREWLLAVVIIILFASNRGYWRVGRYYNFDDKTQVSLGYPATLTMTLEETPLWHNILQNANPWHPAGVPLGDAKVELEEWKTGYHKLAVNAKTNSLISDRTHYWPGWKVFVDKKEVPVMDPYNPLSDGLVTFEVPHGEHVVEVKLTETAVHRTGNIISMAAITACGLALYFPDRRLGIFV